MHSESCNIVTANGSFFDITHSFKAGSATYHVLGLRKDRPTYKNTYYIFNCSGDQHELTKEPLAKSSVRSKRLSRTSELSSEFIQRPRTAHHATRTSVEDLPTKLAAPRPRTRTEPPKKPELNATTIQENLTETIKSNRLLLISSLRRELNIKKKSIIRSMKKEKEALLQATIEANKKEEIIRLLEEQKVSLTDIYERLTETTNSSIESLKQTLIETLEIQSNAAQSAEQIRQTLIQTIEQEVKKIQIQNETVLRRTVEETNVINQLQTTIFNKLDNDANTKINSQIETLNRLFDEQKQALTNVLIEKQQQQEQTLSLDLIKQTVINALNEQKSLSMNVVNNNRQPQEFISNGIVNNISSEQNLLYKNNANNQSLSRMKSTSKVSIKHPVDQHLFRIAVRSPEPAHVYAELYVDGIKYTRPWYTLCQRDTIQENVYNCYFAPPPKGGIYEAIIYAKTKNEAAYRIGLNIRLPESNLSQSIRLPLRHQAFEQHQCILIEPLQRSLSHNQEANINMVIPGAQVVKIRNGDETIELNANEYKKDILKKKVRVRGDIHVIGCWDNKTDSTICVFKMD